MATRKITEQVRQQYGTVGDKYPIPPGDKAHAEAALRLIGKAKPPLTPAQKARVEARAHAVLGQGHRPAHTRSTR